MSTNDTRPAEFSSAASSVDLATGDSSHEGTGLIHPIIIYPYSFPKNTTHLERLYEELVAKHLGDASKFCKPITVINQQTRQRQEGQHLYDTSLKMVRKYCGDPCYTWSVDTCQMWLSGFGAAYDNGKPGDVYWLIPADFRYAEPIAKDEKDTMLEMLKIPHRVNKREDGQIIELSLGQIKVPINSAKQLIDTYGTYGLLYNWFPAEGKGIRARTDKPRTEFFAISHSYLSEVLSQRWYAYEQTIIILLGYMKGTDSRRKIAITQLGSISDEEADRDDLTGAMMQVERTERVLKLYWRESQRRQEPPEWRARFRQLDRQSEQIRGAALVILEQILKPV